MEAKQNKLNRAILMLIFRVGEQQFAINTSCIVEVLPAVPLQQVHAISEAIAGLFNYQGDIVPVINLNHLLGEADPALNLNRRIILIRQSQADEQEKVFGLLVEKITETLAIEPSELHHDDELNHLFQNPYLGETFLHQNNIFQRLLPEHLLSDQEYHDLVVDVELDE
jgi:chemotaxis-related protein WspB